MNATVEQLWRVEYVGQGVVSNKAGVFQHGTIAYVDEKLAQELSDSKDWQVHDPSGSVVISSLPPPAAVTAEMPQRSSAGWPSAGSNSKHGKKKGDEGKPSGETETPATS